MSNVTDTLLAVSGVLGKKSGGGGWTPAVQSALLNLMQHVAYTDDQGQTYYDALVAALGGRTLSSISAVFTQGQAVIYDTDSLDTLKQYLVVTATYSDSTTETVTAYTLSGTLAAGTSTITVSYGGKTDTFDVTVTQFVPDGYITDGLVFFLDGKSNVSSTKWTDIIGGKEFELHNCTLGTNCIVFNGTSSYGDCSGRITNNFEGETIEIVLDGRSNITACTVLSQPYMDDSVGISMRFGLEVGYTPRFAIGLDATQRAYYYKQITQDKNRIGANADRVVVNEAAATSTNTTSYAKNQTGITYVGAGRFTLEGDVVGFYNGKIYAIRIYNRKLTEAEIVANQQNDVTYYGLS